MSCGYLVSKVGGKTILSHRLIMEKCLGRKLIKDEVVHHINGNGKDNRVDNLQLLSRSEHTKIHERRGDLRLLRVRGGLVPSAKLTARDVLQIKLLLKECYGIRRIARLFKVHHKTIQRVMSGETWSWIK